MKLKAKGKAVTTGRFSSKEEHQSNTPKSIEPLHTKYRPKELGEVLGNAGVTSSLEKLLSRGAPHAFLFVGPSGTGKTTLARIIANKLGCTTAESLIEKDAASQSGVDDMRDLVQSVVSRPWTPGNRAVIIDECHMLSKAAWNSLLKITEEPPEHLYWILCTTEPSKVPATIKTRCHAYDLKPVPWQDIEHMLQKIADKEKLKLFSTRACEIIAKKSSGSPRQALVYLSAVAGTIDEVKAMDLMAVAEERKEIIQFVRYICFDRNCSFMGAMQQLKSIQEQGFEPESVRIVMVNYVAAVLMGSKGGKQDIRLAQILAAFSEPYNASDKYAPLVLSVANALL